ncbi:methyltransferase [Canibacter sp. lx-72]|uniref:class I SAM-dependent methyltransferase n=1 Tax=Canibacter zhuwentaonis TaxID=2837491 RepID=UPI001BDBCBD4|nr:methyltransferase [Canibacter zhuwentaonis]MBT1017928.1 methyltransferase [Canibacter zhuwentaonis]MBT1035091.1 methyltransferase [Canibacter zhuwentaonis]
MVSEHYFSQNPLVKSQAREIQTQLGNRSVTVTTDTGVFSSAGVDRGTAVLLQHTPDPQAGNILDMGCGWGAIALDTALKNPAATVWALDINERALELTSQNAKQLQLPNIKTVTAEQIPEGVKFSEIRSNPPIRIGKKHLHALLLTWLPRLASGGTAYLVVAKSLGAPSLQRWLADTFTDFTTELHVKSKGFYVLAVTRNKPPLCQ